MQAATSLWGCLIALELCPCTSKASRPSFGNPDSLTKKFVSGSSTLGKFQLPTNIRDIVSHWNIKTKAGKSRGLTIHRELAIARESEGNHLPPSFKHQTCPYIGWITDIDVNLAESNAKTGWVPNIDSQDWSIICTKTPILTRVKMPQNENSLNSEWPICNQSQEHVQNRTRVSRSDLEKRWSNKSLLLLQDGSHWHRLITGKAVCTKKLSLSNTLLTSCASKWSL
jgi:hypothetical protein